MRNLPREVAERHLPAGITVKECRQTVAYGASCAREALLAAAKDLEGKSSTWDAADCADWLRALAGESDE